jgi:hypothetical protein
MANLANQDSRQAKPTEEEILAEAVKQSGLLQAQQAADEAIKQKLSDLIAAVKENGFKRARP